MLQPFKEIKHEYKYLKNINRLECFQYFLKNNSSIDSGPASTYITVLIIFLPVPKHCRSCASSISYCKLCFYMQIQLFKIKACHND